MGYPYYFLFTLTPYDVTLEPGVPEKHSLLKIFRQLSRLIGPERVVWRYDPVVLSELFTPDWHAEAFIVLRRNFPGSRNVHRQLFRRLPQGEEAGCAIRYTLPDKR